MKKYFFSAAAVGLISLTAIVGNYYAPKKIAQNSIAPIITDQSTPATENGAGNNLPEIKKVSLPGFNGAQVNPSDLEKFKIDSDSDGLPDFLENFYGTNPNNPDTDNDGFKDGEEVKNGYNPLGDGKLPQ